MAQGVLPFKYEAEKKTTGMTALAGLPTYLDLAKVIGLLQHYIWVLAPYTWRRAFYHNLFYRFQ